MANIAIIIPAFNEEVVIQNTIQSVLDAGFKNYDIYVIDDCSSDKTSELAKQLNVNVFKLKKNGGKAKAINSLLYHAKIYDNYDYVVFLDADSILSKDFKKKINSYIKDYPYVALFVGQVKSRKGTYITSYRAMEYAFAHDFYKDGQNNFNLVYVSPGCNSIYATDVLKKLYLSGDTLAEDMDLTLQVHRIGGTVKYVSDLIVYTQDPQTLKDYIKQITRWYRGGCQVMKKHKTFNPFSIKKRPVDFYMMFLVLEALVFNRIAFGLWLLFSLGLYWFITVLGIDMIILFLVAIYGTIRTRRLDIIYNFPRYFWLPYLASIIFTKSFFEVFILNQNKLSWNKVKRYEEKAC